MFSHDGSTTAGKIGFLELTRMIAKRWGEVDDETRQYCKMMAAMELVKYKEDMESYNVYKERLEAIGEIPQDMKERLAKKKRAADRKKAPSASSSSAPPPLPKPTRKSARRAAAVRADRVISRFVAPQISVPPSRRAIEPIAAAGAAAQPSPGAGHDATDMEAFISSIVNDDGGAAAPAGPASSPAATAGANTAGAAGRLVTPDRQGAKKRRIFRRRQAALPTAASRSAARSAAGSAVADELTPRMPPAMPPATPPGEEIRLTFSGIDEAEIAREFAPEVVSPPGAGGAGAPGVKMSFDYWDALVESTGVRL